MKVKVCVGNSSVVKIYIIRPKPGPVAKNATPLRPSGWESNPRPLDYYTSAPPLSYRSRCRQLGLGLIMYIFTTLEFPTYISDFHLLTTSVNAKYYYIYIYVLFDSLEQRFYLVGDWDTKEKICWVVGSYR